MRGASVGIVAKPGAQIVTHRTGTSSGGFGSVSHGADDGVVPLWLRDGKLTAGELDL